MENNFEINTEKINTEKMNDKEISTEEINKMNIEEKIKIVAQMSLFLSETNSTHINKSLNYYQSIFKYQCMQIQKHMILLLIFNLILINLAIYLFTFLTPHIMSIMIIGNIGVYYYWLQKKVQQKQVLYLKQMEETINQIKMPALKTLKEIIKNC